MMMHFSPFTCVGLFILINLDVMLCFHSSSCFRLRLGSVSSSSALITPTSGTSLGSKRPISGSADISTLHPVFHHPAGDQTTVQLLQIPELSVKLVFQTVLLLLGKSISFCIFRISVIAIVGLALFQPRIRSVTAITEIQECVPAKATNLVSTLEWESASNPANRQRIESPAGVTVVVESPKNTRSTMIIPNNQAQAIAAGLGSAAAVLIFRRMRQAKSKIDVAMVKRSRYSDILKEGGPYRIYPAALKVDDNRASSGEESPAVAQAWIAPSIIMEALDRAGKSPSAIIDSTLAAPSQDTGDEPGATRSIKGMSLPNVHVTTLPAVSVSTADTTAVMVPWQDRQQQLLAQAFSEQQELREISQKYISRLAGVYEASAGRLDAALATPSGSAAEPMVDLAEMRSELAAFRCIAVRSLADWIHRAPSDPSSLTVKHVALATSIMNSHAVPAPTGAAHSDVGLRVRSSAAIASGRAILEMPGEWVAIDYSTKIGEGSYGAVFEAAIVAGPRSGLRAVAKCAHDGTASPPNLAGTPQRFEISAASEKAVISTAAAAKTALQEEESDGFRQAAQYLDVEAVINEHLMQACPGVTTEYLGSVRKDGRRWLLWAHAGSTATIESVLRDADWVGSLAPVTSALGEDGLDCSSDIEGGIAELERLAVRVAAELLGLCASLERVGTAHRDVKPHNLLVLPGGAIRLLDFGSAADMGGVVAIDGSGGDDTFVCSPRVGYNPGASPCDPKWAPPERFIDEEHWATFDTYSAALVVLRLLLPPLWSRRGYEAFAGAWERCGYSLDAWLATDHADAVRADTTAAQGMALLEARTMRTVAGGVAETNKALPAQDGCTLDSDIAKQGLLGDVLRGLLDPMPAKRWSSSRALAVLSVRSSKLMSAQLR